MSYLAISLRNWRTRICSKLFENVKRYARQCSMSQIDRSSWIPSRESRTCHGVAASITRSQSYRKPLGPLQSGLSQAVYRDVQSSIEESGSSIQIHSGSTGCVVFSGVWVSGCANRVNAKVGAGCYRSKWRLDKILTHQRRVSSLIYCCIRYKVNWFIHAWGNATFVRQVDGWFSSVDPFTCSVL